MKRKSLRRSNPYLQDVARADAALVQNVLSSAAVEDIRLRPEDLLTDAARRAVTNTPQDL